MSKIALLTMEDGKDLAPDDKLIIPPLRKCGFDVSFVPWADTSIDWSAIDAAIIRSTYDYTDDVDAFVTALQHIEAAGTALFNPAHVVKWNTVKTYLADIERAGAPIVPSLFGRAGTPRDIADAQETFACDTIIAKPCIGAGGDGVTVIDAKGPSPDETTPSSLPGGLLLQPFIESIQTEGEYSAMYFGGRFSHAVRKVPQTGGILVQEEHGGTTVPCEASDALLDRASASLYAAASCCGMAPEALLYARIDLVRGRNDDLLVSEVELIEPQLFLHLNKEAPTRFADAVLKTCSK